MNNNKRLDDKVDEIISLNLDAKQLRDETIEKKNSVPIKGKTKINAVLDPNEVIPHFAFKKPIIVFYGARATGKSVAIMRLVRYLVFHEEYRVSPDREFIQEDIGNNFKYFSGYQNFCDDFEQNYLQNEFAPDSTKPLDFMLLNVIKDGNIVFQLLEAPGEHFFDKTQPEKDYKSYFIRLMESDIPKFYIVFLQEKWESDFVRQNFSQRIIKLFDNKENNRDYIVLLFNRADEHNLFIQGQRIIQRYPEFKQSMVSYYPTLFNKIDAKHSQNWFDRLFLKSTYSYLPFSSGRFPEIETGKTQFILSDDIHPKMLFKLIKKKGLGYWI